MKVYKIKKLDKVERLDSFNTFNTFNTSNTKNVSVEYELAKRRLDLFKKCYADEWNIIQLFFNNSDSVDIAIQRTKALVIDPNCVKKALKLLKKLCFNNI